MGTHPPELLFEGGANIFWQRTLRTCKTSLRLGRNARGLRAHLPGVHQVRAYTSHELLHYARPQRDCTLSADYGHGDRGAGWCDHRDKSVRASVKLPMPI